MESEPNKETIQNLDYLSSEFTRVEKLDNKSSINENTTNNEFNTLNKKKKDKNLPYPNGDEIPEIKIRVYYYDDDKFK